ncbi:hypothetical protein J6590_039061 [Homalodisca vitripennis]|nr:hypothetical protein J6590_039061 [Homalodisca vitripennis]
MNSYKKTTPEEDTRTNGHRKHYAFGITIVRVLGRKWELRARVISGSATCTFYVPSPSDHTGSGGPR